MFIYLLYISMFIYLTKVINMGRLIIDIPDDLHDKLRHMKVDKKKDIKDIIIEAINKNLEEDGK